MDRAFIIYDLVKSAQVAEHLLRNMEETQMAEFICKACITVWRKQELLKEFGFYRYGEIGEGAIHSLKEPRGQEFVLRSFLSGQELETRRLASFEEVEKLLKEGPLHTWHILDIWEKDLKTWSFYFAGQHLIYFSDWEGISKGDVDSLLFAPNNMKTVDLPVPFQVGDLLEIDCTPFAPVKHGVVLSKDMHILFLDSNGSLYVDSLGSGCIFGTGKHNMVPPLYGVEVVKHSHGDILEGLQNYIGGKAENAEKILHCFRKYSEGTNRLEQDGFLWCMEQGGDMIFC